MSSYSATMIVKGLNGTVMTGSGSFKNINIDGRWSQYTAVKIARALFEKEAEIDKMDYIGFAIEKTNRFVDYKNPTIVDNNTPAKEIAFLL